MTEFRVVTLDAQGQMRTSRGAYPDVDSAAQRIRDAFSGPDSNPFPNHKFVEGEWGVEQWDEGEGAPTTRWKMQSDGDLVVI